MTVYTNDQVEEMAKEAEAVAELYKAVDAILHPDTNRTDKEECDVADENVIYVDFGLKREFEKAQTMPLKLPQLIAVYHDWAFRSFLLAKANQTRLKNKKVREMVELNHAIVGTIQDIMPKPRS
jgi:hypothetical protein